MDLGDAEVSEFHDPGVVSFLIVGTGRRRSRERRGGDSLFPLRHEKDAETTKEDEESCEIRVHLHGAGEIEAHQLHFHTVIV